MSVRDDGKGLPKEPRESGGIGLRTMAYRARLIGAFLDVRRRNPSGTAVSCAFPLPETPDTPEDPDHARNIT